MTQGHQGGSSWLDPSERHPPRSTVYLTDFVNEEGERITGQASSTPRDMAAWAESMLKQRGIVVQIRPLDPKPKSKALRDAEASSTTTRTIGGVEYKVIHLADQSAPRASATFQKHRKRGKTRPRPAGGANA